MQTIIIKLDSEKMENPDLSICYDIPDRIQVYSNGKICDNGYDYLENPNEIGIWLETEAAEENWQTIVSLFREEKIRENDLSKSAEIYISECETDEIENCRRVYPE